MNRRGFAKVCAAGAALAATCPRALAARDAEPRFYSRALLVTELGEPLRASELAPERNYIFHYPYGGTPCFLLNLGRPTASGMMLRTADGQDYLWQGGVGPNRAIVAYSAICAHQLAYPTKQISFISYRDAASASPTASAKMIHCCAEHSEYDPARGAKVMGGPAEQPLAAILLEHDPQTDRLTAVGTLGGELFNRFFQKYEFKLSLDYGSGKARSAVSGNTVVSELTQFCRQQVRC
jgi:arsenite oxidase small subunit